MKFSADEHGIYIHGAEKAVREYMERYMGASYSKPKDMCKLPRTLGVMEELYRNISGIRELPGFMDMGYKLQREEAALLHLQNRQPEPIEGDKLRFYQRQDAEYLAEVDEAGVFNDPRTGKTPTILTALRLKGRLRNLVVCPASLIWTWERQTQEWFPAAAVFVIGGKLKAEVVLDQFLGSVKQGVPSVLIVSKNRVGRVPALMAVRFDTLVVDEAHFLRNYNTAQSKAIYNIKADQRFALTGTPTVKHPSDIYGLLKFMFPKMFTSFWTFAGRYFEEEFNPFNATGKKVGKIKAHRENELKKLVALRSVSRKRKDVMPWLPEKEPKTIYAKMGTAQQKAYDEMRSYFMTILDSGEQIDAANALSQLMRLRQLAIDPRTVGGGKPGCKTETLIQWLKDRDQAENAPVVVMSMFTSYLNLLKTDLEGEGYKVGMITGEMSGSAKQEAADKFQAGELDVILCNTISAGTGWTLDRGDTVIFMDNAWNPSDQEQAEDRVTPTTPERLHAHRIIHIATVDSVDEKMFAILAYKKSLTDILNNNARDAIRGLIS